MKPPKAAFVAVLKSADDIRLFQKLALSWLEIGFQIFCFGSQSSLETQKNYPQVTFYCVYKHARLHWQRALVGFRIFWHLCRIRPQMVICGAVELLPFCVLFKILAFLCFRRVYLCYDVQENYASNILFTENYTKIFRGLLAKLVNMCQWVCGWGVDKFFLAEKCYVQELSFLRNRFLVLENKFSQNSIVQANFEKKETTDNSVLQILHAGTLSTEYGTEKVLEVAQFLSQQNISYKLHIIGRCSYEKLYHKLQSLAQNSIFTNISLSPIAYEHILAAYAHTHIVLMPYQVNKAYQNRIPTKFYEAMAHNVWIWVQENAAWRRFFQEYGYEKVVFTDFWSESPSFDILPQISFLEEKSYANPNIFWENEKEKIFLWLKSLHFLQKSSKKS
jgi:glycosyltransferase involved in cell wall biosynthesis